MIDPEVFQRELWRARKRSDERLERQDRWLRWLGGTRLGLNERRMVRWRAIRAVMHERRVGSQR